MLHMPEAALRFRDVEATIEPQPDAGEGHFLASSSVFGIDYPIGIDSRGKKVYERINAGAYSESLKLRPVVPVYYNHGGPPGMRWQRPPIGAADSNSENDRSLIQGGSIFRDASEDAMSVWLAMKSGALREWSVAYAPSAPVTRAKAEDGGTVEIISAADLHEVSVCLRGMNGSTSTLDLRALDDKALLARMRGLMPRLIRTRDIDTDDDTDPGAISQAVDSAIDEALDIWDSEPDQAKALIQAADLAIDKLMALLGVPDPDESAASRSLTTTEARRMFQLVARGVMSEDDAVRLIARKED